MVLGFCPSLIAIYLYTKFYLNAVVLKLLPYKVPEAATICCPFWGAYSNNNNNNNMFMIFSMMMIHQHHPHHHMYDIFNAKLQ